MLKHIVLYATAQGSKLTPQNIVECIVFLDPLCCVGVFFLFFFIHTVREPSLKIKMFSIAL